MKYLLLALPFVAACSSQPLPLAPSTTFDITVRVLEYATNAPIHTYSQEVAGNVESCVTVQAPGYRAMQGFGTVCGTVRSSGETWSFYVVKEQ